MESDVKNVTIWYTTVPGVGTVQMSVAVPGAQNVPGQNGTLSDFVGNDFAGVPYASYNSSTDYRISTAIVIGAQLYTMNAAIQPDMLAHEMLHIYTGKNDKDLAASLGLAVGTTGPSIAIERYLESDCTLKVFK